MAGGLVISKYNIRIPLRNGRALIYNSSTNRMALLSEEEMRTLDGVAKAAPGEVDPEVAERLENDGMAISDSIDELERLQQTYTAQRFDPSNMILSIAPTMACNFKCDYCYQGQDKPSQTMSTEVQDAIVKLVASISGEVKNLNIGWYGGEPLLRSKLIMDMSDRMMRICDDNGMNYSAMLVTNGYKLDLEAARNLHERGVTWIQITLDGTPEYHNTRRYLLSGKGSFERIIDNLKAIVDEVPITYAIRVNIDDRNHGDIHKLIEHMTESELGHRKNLKMYFAPIEAMTEGCHVVEGVTLTKSKYGELETELYRHGYKAGLTTLPHPPRFHGICGAVRPNGIVVLPNGDLHKCWDTVSDPKRKVGSIFAPQELSNSLLVKKWLNWTPFDNASCRNCKLLPSCAGGCGYKFVHAESTRGEAAVLPCPSWKYNIKERLLWQAIGVGKVKEDDYDPEQVKTVPAELCADDIIEGEELPEGMQAYIERQRRHLTVL